MERSQAQQAGQKTQQMEEKTEQMGNEHKSAEVINKITKDMLIGDLVQSYPEAIEPLLAEGVHCIGCGASYFETIEQGLMGHGRSAEDADAVVEKLNEAVEAARKEASNREAGGDGSLSLTVTKEAAEKVRDILSKEGDDVSGIRIAVIPGGCAGFEYEFSFEKKQQAEKKGQAENRGQSEDMDQADDFVIEEGGVKFFVDAASMDMLKGAKIDYIENLQASGFKISNPNAKTSCGCGHSFG